MVSEVMCMGAPYFIKTVFTIPAQSDTTALDSVRSITQTINYDEGTRTFTPAGNLDINEPISTFKSPVVFNITAGTDLFGSTYPIANLEGIIVYETGADGSQELLSYYSDPVYWDLLKCVKDGPFSLNVTAGSNTSGNPFTVNLDMHEVDFNFPALPGRKVKMATIQNTLGSITYTGTNSYFPSVACNVTGTIPLQPYTIPEDPVSYGGQTWRAQISSSL